MLNEFDHLGQLIHYFTLNTLVSLPQSTLTLFMPRLFFLRFKLNWSDANLQVFDNSLAKIGPQLRALMLENVEESVSVEKKNTIFNIPRSSKKVLKIFTKIQKIKTAKIIHFCLNMLFIVLYFNLDLLAIFLLVLF